MNTIVWVMMVYSHAGNWSPSIEFKDEKKCQIAAQEIQKAYYEQKSWSTGGMTLPKGVRIEK